MHKPTPSHSLNSTPSLTTTSRDTSLPSNIITSTGLDLPHIRLQDITPWLTAFKQQHPAQIAVVGHSFEQRPIHKITIGKGKIKILAWTQMHGDEATATPAVIDLIETLQHNNKLQAVADNWEEHITLHIVPMLNPDGAQRCTRQNGQCIDMNRDAVALQTPEGRLLMALVEEIRPDFAFNLHDQSPYYQCGATGNPATIAFLAPAFNIDKNIDASRKKAMQMIAKLTRVIEKEIPQHVARYDDAYGWRCFGDNIAKKGPATILIEAGAHRNDDNRQVARRLNTLALLTAINSLISKDYLTHTCDEYFAIPENKKEAIGSLLIQHCVFACETGNFSKYHVDIMVTQTARYSDVFTITNIGDLTGLAGLRTFDAADYRFKAGKPYELTEPLHLTNDTYLALLQQGYSHFIGDQTLLSNASEYSVLVNPVAFHTDHAALLNGPAYGLFYSEGKSSYAMINGLMIELN